MDLQHFVSLTISQIIRGVDEARNEITHVGALVNPKLYDHPANLSKNGRIVAQDGTIIQHVEFDVAVTVTSESTTSTVPTIGVVSAGSQEEKYASLGQNRIKFSIPISLP